MKFTLTTILALTALASALPHFEGPKGNAGPPSKGGNDGAHDHGFGTDAGFHNADHQKRAAEIEELLIMRRSPCWYCIGVGGDHKNDKKCDNEWKREAHPCHGYVASTDIGKSMTDDGVGRRDVGEDVEE